VIRLAAKRKAWLFFCAGVKHAQNVCQELINQGVSAACVSGNTPKAERDRILTEFKAGRIRALTNANVLTTGFDYPDIDLIAMLRPTMSASLYVQMAGRGMRPKSHTDHCLVLDFAGVVEMHGPITNVQPPKKGGSGEGEAPVKVCDNCHEIVHISCMICPNCGHEFPPPAEKKLVLRQDDIMGLEDMEMSVTDWHWRKHISRASGNEMIALTYYGGLTDPPITEYLPVLNQGFAGNKAMQLLHDIARQSNATLSGINQAAEPLTYLVAQMNNSNPPATISYRRDGKFYKVVKRLW
jgi:DNA repair protein RadD